MNNGIASQLFLGIIAREMALDDSQIWIRDQNKVIPNDQRLYVVVGMVGAPVVMSAENYMEDQVIAGDPDADPPVPDVTQEVEVVRVNMKENIQIDIFSRSNDALTRNWEIIAALNSLYSKQVQEANYFKIFRIPMSFANTSAAEGGSNINRYSLIVPCFTWYRKTKVLTEDGGDYYDDFTTRVDDAKTIGTDHPIIEFEINAEGITTP